MDRQREIIKFIWAINNLTNNTLIKDLKHKILTYLVKVQEKQQKERKDWGTSMWVTKILTQADYEIYVDIVQEGANTIGKLNLRNTVVHNRIFESEEMSKVDFACATMTGCTFKPTEQKIKSIVCRNTLQINQVVFYSNAFTECTFKLTEQKIKSIVCRNMLQINQAAFYSNVFTECTFARVIFKGCYMGNTTFKKCVFHEVRFEGLMMMITNVIFEQCTFKFCSLTSGNFYKVTFEECIYTACNKTQDAVFFEENYQCPHNWITI